MFDAYEFDISDCHYYSVYDITIANKNRPHKHEHVEEGLSDYTDNWELVEVDEDMRRGSSNLYLTDDQYWVSCSRTGLESAGNSIKFSSESPKELIYAVVSSVFEGVLSRNSIDISDGVNKEELLDSEGFKVASPRELVLAQSCTQDEIDEYYDQLSDALYALIEEYNNCNDVNDIESAVQTYREYSKELYRNAIDFEPSIVSKTLPDISEKNGWIIDQGDIDGAKKHHLIRHEQNGKNDNIFYIEILNDSVVQVINYIKDENLESYQYETRDELEEYIEDLMEYDFEEMVSLV